MPTREMLEPLMYCTTVYVLYITTADVIVFHCHPNAHPSVLLSKIHKLPVKVGKLAMSVRPRIQVLEGRGLNICPFRWSANPPRQERDSLVAHNKHMFLDKHGKSLSTGYMKGEKRESEVTQVRALPCFSRNLNESAAARFPHVLGDPLPLGRNLNDPRFFLDIFEIRNLPEKLFAQSVYFLFHMRCPRLNIQSKGRGKRCWKILGAGTRLTEPCWEN